MPAETDRHRRSRRPRLTPVERAQLALVLALIAWGVLSFGAVYPWAYRPLALVSLVAGAAGLLAAPRDRRVSLGVAASLAILWLAIAAQQIPMSHGMLARLSPAADGLLRNYEVGYAGAAAHALSIDPSRTWTGLMLAVSFGILWLGLAGSLTERTLVTIAKFTTALGTGVAIGAFIQLTGEGGKVYGFWQPQAVHAHPFGPFVNRNHYAGWMLMAIPLAFGYFLASLAQFRTEACRDWRARLTRISTPAGSGLLLSGFAILVMTTSVLFSLSRSGMACLIVGLAVLTCTALWRNLRGPSGLVVVAYLVFMVVAGVWRVGADNIVARFDEFQTQGTGARADVWRDARTVTSAFPIAGTGLNTFGVAMLFYQTRHPEEIYIEAHNDYLQLAAEGGLLLVIPALLLVAATGREIARRFLERRDSLWTHWIRIGAATGLLMVALQETGEFSLQMPGNAALFCVIIAVAMHRAPAPAAA